MARYRAGRREQNRWAWIRFFDRMAANHAALAEGFRSRAEALINDEAERGGQAGARMKVNEGNPTRPAGGGRNVISKAPGARGATGNPQKGNAR